MRGQRRVKDKFGLGDPRVVDDQRNVVEFLHVVLEGVVVDKHLTQLSVDGLVVLSQV